MRRGDERGELWPKVRRVVRRTFEREFGDETYAPEKPKDEPRKARLWGVATAIAVPVLFASVMPDLATVGGLIWLGGTGTLFGTMTYCRQRALPYLRESPNLFDPLSYWRLLNPARYGESARPFLACQVVCSIILPVWWLGGAIVAFSK